MVSGRDGLKVFLFPQRLSDHSGNPPLDVVGVINRSGTFMRGFTPASVSLKNRLVTLSYNFTGFVNSLIYLPEFFLILQLCGSLVFDSFLSINVALLVLSHVAK